MNPKEQRLARGILFTDMYQLTMAQLYFRMGMGEKEVQFDHFFRDYPDYGEHKAGYCINAGMEWLIDWMKESRFGDEEVEVLRAQKGKAGERLFKDDFLDWLKTNGNFDGITLRAIPEGRVVHQTVPMTVVTGPAPMAQILESPLLNKLNFQTLIATKASRVKQAGKGQLLLEFGMRRGHGDGANAGARAALIGGCDFTSNTGISHVLGFPPKGTHAHSMVQLFMALGEGEIGAFQAYADVYPDDCLLLVDTINTLESGVPNAIKVFEGLKKKGHEPFGIRLDSGDLAYLAVQSAKMLNDAGFDKAKIVLSNQLSEMALWQIISQIEEDAPKTGLEPDHVIGRLIYGVGTRLITSKGKAALDGVYKLVGAKDNGDWRPAIKISENPAKTLNPGNKEPSRLYDNRGMAVADLIALDEENPREEDRIYLQHPTKADAHRTVRQEDLSSMEPLLETILEEGELKAELPPIEELRKRRDKDLERLDAGVRRIINPHIYHVSLSKPVWDMKQRLIEEAKG